MIVSPQSETIIQQLLAKKAVKSGKVTIGPLKDPAIALLTVFVDQFDELSRIKGEERARKLRERFVGRTVTPAANPLTLAAVTASPPIIPVASPQWRLVTLRCCSIRGIAPPGEPFEFHFESQSCLLYGPNGSGKTSLLSAVIWVLTGTVIVDTTAPADQAPLYAVGGGKTSGGKVRDWPIMTTLPTGSDLAKANADCRAELLVESPGDHARLWLGRSQGAPLQVSTDGITWAPLGDITSIGITPLDIQLSLIAPTMFGRRSIEEADNTRSILSLMLGFDDLEQLGELASSLSANRTKLANVEKKEIDTKVKILHEALRLLQARLPEASESAKAIQDLAAAQTLSVARFDTAIQQLEDAANAAESHLSQTLGLSPADGTKSGGLADRLTVAIDQLTKGFDTNFPGVSQLRLATALPADETGTPSERLDAVTAAFANFQTMAMAAMEDRYAWWLKEIAPGSKSSLLLKAAQFYDLSSHQCPVCDRVIEDAKLREHLAALKKLDTAAGEDLRTFFACLSETLHATVPTAVADLSSETLKQRIETGWTTLKTAVLRGELAALSAAFEPNVCASVTLAEDISPPDLHFLPQACEEAFRIAATPFLKAVHSAHFGLALLRWCKVNLSPICNGMHAYLTDADLPTSLLGQLSKGKAEAELVKPLVAVCLELRRLRKDQESIDMGRSQLEILEELADPLNQLKSLSKYAEEVVQIEFNAIKGVTTTNLKHLYPEASTGMRPGNLKLGKGKDKAVEALLTSTSFEAPGQYFANAGLQRAIALAFYFALLEKHTGGIGFVVMDDPILSLDEDHRERWSVNLLRPKLRTLQVILATHQRVFLRHCGNDFTPGRILELNRRSHNSRISFRPGNRLQRAEQQLRDEGDWLGAAVTMRKFREDVLLSLDAFCDTELFVPTDLTGSLRRYQQFPTNHPLSGDAQQKVCDRLALPKVGCVLDPASHSMTEADVTKAMVEDCLACLKEIESTVTRELDRLDALRVRSLRTSVIDANTVAFGNLDARVTWSNTITLPLVGATAAKSNPWSVELSTTGDGVQLPSGGAVQVAGDSLEPVAHFGQWVLLADEGSALSDGDLVAVRSEDGRRYLRRLWSDERQWILQSINPNRPESSVTVAKRSLGIRKIIGVIYSPLGVAKRKAGDCAEWLPCASIDATSVLKRYGAIEVQGNSLDPIARDRQQLLVDQPLADALSCPEGELAVIEFVDDTNGSVVKRVFRAGDRWTLLSPNPVDRLSPIIVLPESIRAVWIVRGVLFETLRV